MIDFKTANLTKVQKQQQQQTFHTGDTLTCQTQVLLIALMTAIFNLDGPVPALVLCLLLAHSHSVLRLLNEMEQSLM